LTRRHLREIDALLSILPKLAVTSRVARTAARFQRRYPIDIADALIAATAYLAGATLVTRNLKHFHAVKELRVQGL
jgi:predicted nucleic acid-binding protein